MTTTLDASPASHVDEQRRRFDAQAVEYSRAHGHALSQAYRDRFMRGDVLTPVLAGARVLDAMCGSGEETGHLLQHSGAVEGLDISPAFVAEYERRWGLPCRCASITDTGLDAESFDVVYICGGLHHVRPELAEAIDECWRVLKPGGALVFVEPNRDSWTDWLRRAWYRVDGRFGDDEAAISIARDITPLTAGRFDSELVRFGGGPAYLLIAQAFITRVPERIRRRVARPLFAFEAALARTPLHPRLFVCARYRKTEGDSPRSVS